VESWPVQDAKARFGEMLDLRLEEGPQLITSAARPPRAARARPALTYLLDTCRSAAEIEAWLEQIAATYNAWTRRPFAPGPSHACKADRLLEDAMIPAAAAVYELTIVTPNVRDFEGFGVPTLNPFVGVPGRRRSYPASRAGTFENREPSPSAMVGWARTAF
jgi:hypothetical protein